MTTPPVQAASPARLYRVGEAMELLSLSRSVIYELIRSGRLRSVREGRSRRIPGSAIAEYIALLESEARLMARAHGKPVAELAVKPAAGGSAAGSGLRIRLVGLPDEVLAGAEALAGVFDLVEVSPAYPCRGASLNVRAYLQVRLKNPGT
ncbi:helix-turn-helix domain-containing protein [Actinomadura madurae]|uniref:helix-turn-helix domain-containing protein n=2 Tax=Actinomadura madurae TaxID=1993 RepID=UPI0020D218DF|nr:helix-turn-helix domain-containing protein [Actinomadura madurae]MCP9954692.1 helix-turn-helix domain-containing protein [Actinomadura madurae]